MCKKFLSLLLSLTILLGAVWVPAGASSNPTPQTVEILFRDENNSNYKPAAVTANINDRYLTYFEKVSNPTRTGYDFKGWVDSETKKDISGSDFVAAPSKGSQIILYAKWEARKITVTCDYGYENRTGTIEVTYDSTYSTLPTVTSNSRPNYTFTGWYTSSSGGTEVTSSTPVTNANNHTIYARWTRDAISVALDYNGGRCNNANNTTVTVPLGDSYSSTISRYTPTRDGFTFDGWTAAKDTDPVIDLTTTIASASSPKTLYAKWSPRKYTVTLNLDCSDEVTGCDKRSFQIGKDETYAQAGSTELGQTPVRTGYDFMGWYTDRNGKGTKIESGTSTAYGKTTDQILYAYWQAKKYTLTYDYSFPQNAAWKGQDGSSLQQPSNPTSPNEATYDAVYPTLPTPAANDIPYYGADSTEKYTFDGWYDLEKDTVNTADPTQNKTGHKITGGTRGDVYRNDGDQTLYARWGYKIEFFANNTDDVTKEDAFGTMDCVTGAPYAVTNMPRKDPVKDGYVFAGWYKSPEASSTNKVELTASMIADGSINKLYAHWTPAEYEVTFDANGGELDGAANVKVTFGSKYPNLPGTKSRTGYTFAGWFTEKDGGTEVTTSTDVTTAGNHILYAHWDPLELTLRFDYNLPAGIVRDDTTHPDLAPAKATYGAPYGAALPTRDPLSVTSDDKVTYKFAGWYTARMDKNAGADGTGEVTGQRVQTSLPVELEYTGSSATLYARWEYKVNFYANLNPNATSQSPISGTNFTAVSGSRYGTLPGQPSGNPSKYFLGWFTEPVGGTEIKATEIADGTTVKLYAHWGNTRTCTVTLDGNGAVLPEGYPKFEIIEYGQNYSKLFNNIADPTRDGYTFQGWYLNPEGTGSAVTSRSTVTGDCTIYAKWKINTFKVTLNLNYGSGSTVKTVDYGTKLGDVLTIPERTGYAFEGWFTDSKCETPADENAVVTADVTLYAKWISAKRVTLVVNGGSLPSGTPAYINVYEGGDYSKLPDPVWLGCTFLGWYTAENGGTQVRPSDVVPASDSIPSVLYAQWAPMDVTVNFDPNGAVNQSVRSRTYKVGATYGTGLSSLHWAGYQFMGWYTQAVGGDKVEASTVIAVKSNTDLEITLYAHWGYTVSFDPSEGNGSMDSQVAEMNQPYTLPVCTFTPPAGMRFGGWAPGTPDAAVTYPGESQYTVTRNVMFYATWTTAPIVIKASSTTGGTLRTEDGRTNEVTVERGEDITFVTQANSGYVLKDLIVDGTSWNYVDVHTFKNVTEDHTIHAVFEPIGSPSYSTCTHGSSCPLSRYGDLKTSEWYHDGIHYCVDNVIMGGTGSDKFYPRRNTTRAELAVSLYNYAGRPAITGSGLLPSTYPDVKAGEWHYQAIEWATREGILSGYGNGKFMPNQSITREQLVAILWRHAGEPKPRSTVLRFYDASKVSDYAWEAMCWATEQGILQGRSNGYLVPKGTATRAEVAEMLKNYLG